MNKAQKPPEVSSLWWEQKGSQRIGLLCPCPGGHRIHLPSGEMAPGCQVQAEQQEWANGVLGNVAGGEQGPESESSRFTNYVFAPELPKTC